MNLAECFCTHDVIIAVILVAKHRWKCACISYTTRELLDDSLRNSSPLFFPLAPSSSYNIFAQLFQ